VESWGEKPSHVVSPAIKEEPAVTITVKDENAFIT
jgi:hypothetical protein